MYKVKRAIILAAGRGERLRPITLDCPKPLVTVCGKRMIDTIIEGLLENAILEIYVVTGYLHEAFQIVKVKYPFVKIIYNPYWETCNNISSLYTIKSMLTDVIIIDGDQVIYNKEILHPLFERSGYSASRVDCMSNEWILTVEEGIITSCNRNGGDHGWQLYGISCWNAEDGVKLRNHVVEEFEKRGRRDIYWDDIPLYYHFEDYQLGIRKIKKEDVVEIDSVEELIRIDKSYCSKE